MAAETTLRDGTSVMIWSIVPSDARGLAERYLGLSEESRYHRFLSAVPSLSEPMLKVLIDEVDRVDHVGLVLVAFPQEGAEQAAGVARLIRLPEEPTLADVAVTVDDAWQGRGVASALLAELISHRPVGVTGLSTVVAADNPASLAMLRRLGPTTVRTVGSGVYEVRVTLPPAPPAGPD
ncbi:MAG TPA: GNAT family N-acetyltransferase [Frankiaceae bacterium]|nr:GNAT family N-acetyltransferase [Frankiaceae bacterium]